MSTQHVPHRGAARTADTDPGSLPNLPHPFSMRWRDGAFCHWGIDPARLAPHVPDRFDLETYDDRAWLSIVPFVLTRAGVRGSPAALRVTRPELNLRTYVRYGDVSGLYFFSIDIVGPWLAAAARRGLGIPCFDARFRVDDVDGRTEFWGQRVDSSGDPVRFAAIYEETGPETPADPGTLAHWVSERRRMLVPRGRHTLVAEIAHDPWPLAPASISITENDLFDAADLPTPGGEPIAYCCDRLEITGSIVRRL